MKNVLLLCVSPVKKEIEKKQYSFENQDGNLELVEGCMTNEAPTKSVIMQVDRLDKIILICSKTVGKAIKVTSNESPITDPENYSHVQFYMELINRFAETYDAKYKENPIEYKEISISDSAGAQEISKVVTEVGNDISSMGDKIQLYLDFNGGQRYVAFMLATIANMMKSRGVDVRQVMTMNYETNSNSVVPIQNMAPVFRSFDLVSGINEYINYGRVKGLKTYFANAKNREIEKILTKMEKFANNLQLCRTGYIMKEKQRLRSLLEEYREKERDVEKGDAYENLFLYVVKDILEGYKGILDGDLPGVITWCLEKDFLQQALTFCSEEMPDYFWRREICVATELERIGYACFLRKLQEENNDKTIRRLKSEYKNGMDKDSSKYAYNWMCKYLVFSNKHAEYEKLLRDSDEEYKKLVFIQYKSRARNSNKNTLGKFQYFNMSNVSKDSENMKKARMNTEKLIWCIEKERAFSKCKDQILLEELFMVYYLLKEQRNNTNHASDEQAEGEAWSYTVLRRVLKDFADKLETMEK